MPRFQLSLNGHTFTTDDLQTAQSFLLSPEACIPTLAGSITETMRSGFHNTLIEAERTGAKTQHTVDGLLITVNGYF